MAASMNAHVGGEADLAPVLAAIIGRHGTALLAHRSRLHGLLRDYAPGAIRDIRLLLTAFDSGAAARLEAAPDPVDPALVSVEAARLADEFGCSPGAAHNAVATWARAFAALGAPADMNAGSATMPVQLAPVAAPVGFSSAVGQEEQQPSWFGRWGGAIVGILLVAVALLRWLGVL